MSTVAEVRRSRCRECGESFDVATTVGPLPSKCNTCDPDAETRRARNRRYSRGRTIPMLLAANARLLDRAAELEAQLAAGASPPVDERELNQLRVEVEELRMAPRFAPRRWRPGTPPTRQSLAVAVRRVGTARGRRETVQRLHELAAEAEAWAARVDSRCNPDPQSALQGRTTT